MNGERFGTLAGDVPESDPGDGAPVEDMRDEPTGPLWFRVMKSSGSTLFLVALVVTVSQLTAMAIAEVELVPGARWWSTGGAVALVSSLLMWKFAPTWRRFRVWIWVPLVLMSVSTFVAVGATNSYAVEIVDQDARAETMTSQLSGEYDVFMTERRICEPGEDYGLCVNAHVAVYNSICVGHPLTWDAVGQCAKFLEFIDSAKEELAGCGYNCTTSGESGRWGWPYMKVQAATRPVGNGDDRPRISHMEYCYFDLGEIEIGICNR